MIRNLVKRIWQKFLELNLFKKHSSNEHTLEKELLSTRIYLIALIVCLSIITITVALIVRPVDKIEYKPSHEKFSQLLRKYPNTLHCPCSKSSTNYDKFVTSEVNFHQVCSSEFIQQTWIEKIFTNENISMESIDDVRITLSFFWQTIAGLCIASNKSWDDVLANFGVTSFITPTAVAERIVRSQAKNALQNQIDLSNTTSVRNLLTFQRIARGNQVVSALQTNFYLRYAPEYLIGARISPRMTTQTFGSCNCLNIEGCPRSATFIDNYSHLINVPGMIVDCLIVDGTLASTLECYYDQSCISILHGQLSMNIQPLSNTSNKIFSMYSTVQSIFNKLMIDETITEIRYDKYFSECNCPFCSYSYTRRFDIYFIFTAVTGSISILSFIIRHIASFIATKILRRKNRILPMENVSTITSMEQNRKQLQLRIRLLLNKLWQAIISLNLFEKQIHRTPTNIYREQLLTRFFIFFIVSLSIAAGVYTIVVEQNQVITKSYPSLHIYRQLYKDYPTTLYCPCSQISISNKVFLNVTFILHQVCSSDLVSLEWLHYLRSFDPINQPPHHYCLVVEDFRKMGASYFQLLAAFCSLAKTNTADAHYVFINTEFINDRVPSEPRFTQQTEAMMTSFINTTTYDFVQTFNWTKLIFLNSPLYNGLNTNVDINKNNDGQMNVIFREYNIQIFIHDDSPQLVNRRCTCGSDPDTCYAIPALYVNTSYLDNINRQLLFKLFEVLYIGCSPLSGFLMSRTGWWYNITYMKDIQATYSMVIDTRPAPNIEPLNESISTQFDNPETNDLLRSSSIGVRFTNFPRIVYDKIKNFNIYETESTDNTLIRQQQIYTRVYLFLYIILLSIVLFYTILIERRIRKTNFLHSIDEYEQLLNLYRDDISCPCTYTSIPYHEFITELNVSSFHESIRIIIFADLATLVDEFMGYNEDYSLWGKPFIESLEQFCSLAQDNVNNNIHVFLASTLFTNQLMSRSLFNTEMNETLCQFKNKTKTTFAHMLDFIRSTIQGNALLYINSEVWNLVAVGAIDIHNTNFLIPNANFLSVPVTLHNTQENTSCSCVTLRACQKPRQVKISDNWFPIDGLVIGCHQLETLLFSSLACFYSLECINALRKSFYIISKPLNEFNGLNASGTRFYVHDTVEKIANEMFIESWSNHRISYEKYFSSCSPSYCIYTYYQKSNALEILTTFLSAYGSLSIVIYFIVPYLVKLIEKILICFRITQQQ
ncbi:unnamed protein product [Adineta steineri]|uniref:Uncharacterized protein n=1 Tax=Adineta steineri TaxID=433720 RepID=A0A819KK93_9BILA|nr:unnamed protein product [Adineta steineri]